MRRIEVLGLAGLLALAGSVGWGREARAQYATSIPFNPWSSQYQSFVYPIVPNNPSIPNAARYMDTYGGPNQLNRYYGEVGQEMSLYQENLPTDAPDLRGRMIPYNSAYRRFDREFGRVYQPNQGVDAKFYEQRAQRDELYIQATTAKDPRERADAQRKLEAFDRDHEALGGISRRLGGPRAPLPSVTRSLSATAPIGGGTVANPPDAPVEAPAVARYVEPAPTLSPYARKWRRTRTQADVRPSSGTVRTTPSALPPPPGLGGASTPDDILRRSRGMDTSEIPPPPDPN